MGDIQSDAQARIPTEYGDFWLQTFLDTDGSIHLVLRYGTINTGERVLVRIHSKCVTGEVFGSLRCDCRPQLMESMHRISEHGSGLIIYLDQEGRGIGLLDKIRAYSVQDKTGKDTVDANLVLGLPIDNRNYSFAIKLLRSMNIQRIALLTNNPHKISALLNAGLDVESVPLVVGLNGENEKYLHTKKIRLHHEIDI